MQNILKAIFEVLILERKNCEVIEAYFQYLIENKKTVKKNTNLILFLIVKLLKEKENIINYQLSKIPNHIKTKDFFQQTFWLSLMQLLCIRMQCGMKNH